MARTPLTTALTTLASSIAKAFRSPTKLQAPERRKALFEAMEQRFLLSVEGVLPPPPPPAQSLPALEAPLNPDVAGQSAQLSASSASLRYTIPAEQAPAAVSDASPAFALSAMDPGGIAATTPSFAALDPTVPGAGTNIVEATAAAQTIVGSSSETPDVNDATANAAAGTEASPGADALADGVLPAVVANSAVVSPVQMSLADYAAFVQSRPAPAQIIIVDAAVPNYQELIRSSLANYGGGQGEVQASAIIATDRPVTDADWTTALPATSSQSEALPAAATQALGGHEDEGPRVDVSRIGDVEVVVIDGRFDGIEQVTDILSAHHGLAAVQILSHGATGNLRLGSSVLNADKLEQQKARISGWGAALRPEGDLLLYGCEVADAPGGVQFVQNLAEATGADAAASTNRTGGAVAGGDWTLEYHTGAVETQQWFTASALSDYAYLLELVTGTVFDDTLTSAYSDDTIVGLTGNDTYKFTDNWGNDGVTEDASGGVDTLDFSEVTSNLTFTIRTDGTIRVAEDGDAANVLEATNIEYLVGGSGTNRYIFQTGAFIVGKIPGGSNGGTATLDYGAYTTSVSYSRESGAATGVFGGAAGGATSITGLTGSSAADTLTGSTIDSRWAITAAAPWAARRPMAAGSSDLRPRASEGP